jgi:hypothetical protein
MALNETRLKTLERSVVILTAVVFGLFWPSATECLAQAETAVRPDPQTLGFPPGDTATTSILVEDVTNLFCFELKIAFDPATVEVVDADPDRSGVQIADGDFLSPDWKLQNAVDNEEGRIAYALCQLNPSEPQSGSGALVSVTWRAIGEGTSAMDLHDVLLAAPLGERISTSVEDGEIVVGSPQPAPGGTPSPSPTVTPSSAAPSWSTPSPTPPSPTPEPTATPQGASDSSKEPTQAAPTSAPTPRPSSTPPPTEASAAAEPTATDSATRNGPPPTEGVPAPGGTTVPSAANAGEGNGARVDDPMETPTDAITGPTQTPSANVAEAGIPDDAATSEDTSDEAAIADRGEQHAQETDDEETETSSTGLFGLSSSTIWLIALACLVAGAGALAYASVLWKRDRSER